MYGETTDPNKYKFNTNRVIQNEDGNQSKPTAADTVSKKSPKAKTAKKGKKKGTKKKATVAKKKDEDETIQYFEIPIKKVVNNEEIKEKAQALLQESLIDKEVMDFIDSMTKQRQEWGLSK